MKKKQETEQLKQHGPDYSFDAVHTWFGLTYASYLTLPRVVLQSMPDEWQEKFVRLLDEIPETLEIDDMPDYRVNAVNNKGKFITDQYGNYRHNSVKRKDKQ